MLVPGGMVAFDDYSSYSGCTRAVDEWIAAEPSLQVVARQRSIVVRRT
jgi:hypothetical protein